jgi:hypothetical protein
MIYLLCGERKIAYDKAQNLINALLKKQPDANLLKFNLDNYDDEKINELIESQGLFVLKNIILLSGIFSDIKSDYFEKNLKKINESENIFIIVEKEIKEDLLKKINDLGVKIQQFSVQKKIEKKDNRLFEIADLFGRKDKKELWIKYQDLLNSFDSVEILNIIWWQLKSIISAKKSENCSDSGLAPYVYTKSKSFSKNFSTQELEDLIEKINLIQNESFFDSEIIKPKLENLFLSY